LLKPHRTTEKAFAALVRAQRTGTRGKRAALGPSFIATGFAQHDAARPSGP